MDNERFLVYVEDHTIKRQKRDAEYVLAVHRDWDSAALDLKRVSQHFRSKGHTVSGNPNDGYRVWSVGERRGRVEEQFLYVLPVTVTHT